MADTVQKYIMKRVADANGNLVVVHPETEAEHVLYSNTIGTTDVTNVDQALDALKANSGVTGVKGAAESTYHKGNVNLTPANIGAVASNAAIAAGTFTRVTVDAKGLVTGGSQATLDNIPDGTTRKIPTDYIPISQKGANNGVATLGDDGKVPTSQLPSFVDDVLSYASKSSFPTVGETGKIYVATDTNITYRWSGSAYVEISASLALGETSSTAYAGDKGAENRTRIIAVEGDITKIKNGTTAVGKATDADKLGSVDANQYALKTDIPGSELFVIRCNLNGAEVESFDETFNDISYAMANGVVPILFVYSRADNYQEPTPFYFQYDGGDYFDFVRTTAEGVIESITLYSSNDVDYSTITSISDVTDNGTGAIVSKIEKSGGAVSVTRRAITNDDLPTPEFDTSHALYSAVRVNAKGIVTAGGNSIEWGTSSNNVPSDALMVGGLFFELVE